MRKFWIELSKFYLLLNAVLFIIYQYMKNNIISKIIFNDNIKYENINTFEFLFKIEFIFTLLILITLLKIYFFIKLKLIYFR